MEKLEIRSVKAGDEAQIYEVFRQTWLDTYPNQEHDIQVTDIQSKYPEEKRTETIENYGEFYKSIIQNPEQAATLVWVAEENGIILGVVTVDKQTPIRLGALYVLPQFQKQGVGRQLMEFVLEKFGHQGMVLNVASYNINAIKFYENYGFKITRKVQDPNGQLPTGKIIPEIEMKRSA